MRLSTSLIFTCFLTCTILAADPPTKPGDAQIDAWLKQETAKLRERFLDGAKTKADWEAKRPRLKQEYFDMLGLNPLPEKTPLSVTVTGTVERGDVVIEKLHFQSRPGLYVTGNLYRPKKSDGKLPTILYVCGHSGKGRDGNKTAFQDHGMWFASNGYICLIIDSLQLGEVPGVHHGTYGIRNENYALTKDPVETRWRWQARGYTPAGVECWNGIRAIDYLVSRPDVDAERIGVTGISGGGAATIWIAAADERVKVAVPVSGMSDLECYVSNKIINGHCDCMLMINTFGWEWTTIAALIAPRPMLFCNSDNDPIFSMDGNKRISARLRQLYKMYEKPDLFDDYVSSGGHAYRPDLRVAIFKFINKHLKSDTAPVKDADFQPLPGKELRAFADELPKDEINSKVDEVFVPAARVALPEAGKFEDWKKRLIQQLREKSFRQFPDRVAPGRLLEQISDPAQGFPAMAEPGIKIRVVFGSDGPAGTSPSMVVLEQGDGPNGAPPWSEDVLPGEIFTVSPRGHGISEWTRKNPPNYVERSHALLGHTVDERRVYDTIGMFRYYYGLAKDQKWQLAGRGQAGVIAAYAAIFEPDVPAVVLKNPPASHRDGPIFLNVLRVLDVPEALGLLAPRPLTIYSNDKAFDRTAEIYKIAGAADKFKRVEMK
ncbi:MAG TPA: acetylxylan esterase [Gemmataceae bacterium]|nr:acetylxylan esterase [Gemmataceae bacterium]